MAINPYYIAGGGQKVTIGWIEHIVCNELGIDEDQIRTPERKQEYVAARYLIFYLATRYARWTTSLIGELYNRDHSTVVHGRKSVKNTLDNPYDKYHSTFTYLVNKVRTRHEEYQNFLRQSGKRKFTAVS